MVELETNVFYMKVKFVQTKCPVIFHNMAGFAKSAVKRAVKFEFDGIVITPIEFDYACRLDGPANTPTRNNGSF